MPSGPRRAPRSAHRSTRWWRGSGGPDLGRSQRAGRVRRARGARGRARLGPRACEAQGCAEVGGPDQAEPRGSDGWRPWRRGLRDQMFAIRIDLLTERYAATAYNDRERVEWPPHPARLFSALVATWAEGQLGTAEGDAELVALQWLQTQPAPRILASSVARTAERTAAVAFVPVNDVGVIRAPDHSKLEAAERALAEADAPESRAKAEKQLTALKHKLVADTAKETAAPAKFGKHDAASAEQALLDRRVRQPRTFPCAMPEVPAFAFKWDSADVAPVVASALFRLTQRLVRLGHSSSMVHARIADGAVLAELAARTAEFVPDEEDGDVMIRWVSAGQTERLIHAHGRHQQVEPRVLPARFVRYR